MREIHVDAIAKAVKELSIRANTELGQDVLNAFEQALEQEESPTGRDILKHLLVNAQIARDEKIPMCQDTGLAVVFLELGQEVHIVGGSLKDAIEEGVRQGYQEGYLRKSACHPFTRQNTGDNTPAIIHVELVAGDGFKLILAPKGGGSENMSRFSVLKPSQGRSGVIDFVVQAVSEAGSNPCPPLIVGVGIGGTAERCMELSKRALLRPAGQSSPDPETAELEHDMLVRINALGIGPQGLGGRITALAVHVETHAAHIASLPVAVNLQCHSARHKEAVL